MLNHTPAPWVVDYGGTIGHIKSTSRALKLTPTICRYDKHAISISENESQDNARLIAAAPRMYEILDAIREEQVDGISRQIWIKRETLKLLTEMEGRIDGN